MKKTALILVVVAVLVAVVYYVDKKTRLQPAAANMTRPDPAATDAAGKPAPDFAVKDLDGKDITLADYKGKVVLVNFSATWCHPCRVEIAGLIDLQNNYVPAGFI